jgi:hypothetical protein
LLQFSINLDPWEGRRKRSPISPWVFQGWSRHPVKSPLLLPLGALAWGGEEVTWRNSTPGAKTCKQKSQQKLVKSHTLKCQAGHRTPHVIPFPSLLSTSLTFSDPLLPFLPYQ